MTRVRTGKLLQRRNWVTCSNTVVVIYLVMQATRLWSVPQNTRAWFTPQVVPLTYTQSVRFEATVTESPASVVFEYNGVDRPMYDDGTHGDLVAGDGTWTILFQANEILSKLTPAWVYRPLNSMELYLMGLVPSAEVSNFFVLNDQNMNLTVGQTLQATDITPVTVSDVVAACGPRVPASTDAQRTFRAATIVLSEQLLDPYAMSFYDWFARRGEAKQRLNAASGLATGTCNPFYLATGGRGFMFTKINDDQPVLAVGRPTNGVLSLAFTAKPGISYQPQVSSNLVSWVNQGLPVTAPSAQPPVDAVISVTVTSTPSALRSFYRLSCNY